MIRSASARYEGLGKDGKGHVSTQSGVLSDQQYGFNTRFEDGKGTNPEELIAAAHASCFTMALSFALAGAGFTDGTLETTAKVTLDKDGDGFKVSKSALTLTATGDGGPVDFAVRDVDYTVAPGETVRVTLHGQGPVRPGRPSIRQLEGSVREDGTLLSASVPIVSAAIPIVSSDEEPVPVGLDA